MGSIRSHVTRRHHLEDLLPIGIMQSYSNIILGSINGTTGSLIKVALTIAIELQVPSARARITAVHAGMGADLNVASGPDPQLEAGAISRKGLG
jgi:hypothetical protein